MIKYQVSWHPLRMTTHYLFIHFDIVSSQQILPVKTVQFKILHKILPPCQ